ncbi:MAG: SIMPL domain-containing protein [Candidatus Korobacteraceae bacterium]
MQKPKALFVALLMALAGSLAISTPATAQEQSSKVIPNAVWVGADGKFESDPDTALVQFGVSAQEEKLQDANQKATQAAEQIRQLLRTNGLDPKEAQISRFATQPVYDYKNPKRKLVGYRVDANISIKLKDFSKIGPIAEGLATLDVTDTSISYLLEDMDAAKIKAVEDALRRAHNEANAIAQSSGRALGELSYASVDTYEQQPIRPMMAKAATMAAQAAPPPTAEFSAEKITVTAHVNALYNLK